MKKAEPLGKGWMRGRVGRHRACRRERVRTGIMAVNASDLGVIILTYSIIP